MKKLLLASLLLTAILQQASAQRDKNAPDGTGYYLPKTELRFTVQVEKTTYQPGDFAIYAEKYLKMNGVSTQPAVTYRITNISLLTEAERDTSKYHVAPADSKHNIQTIDIDDNGVLLAVNAEPKQIKRPAPFSPAPKPKAINPRDYMNEDMLSAGSSAKMAELCALEIYDIRDSRSLLSKGQADFMPKDGDQLRMMLNNLDTQERALLQLFTGVTVKDTTETVVTFMPEKPISKHLLFRFSKWLGMTDADDLGGSPYYVSVEDLKQIPAVPDGTISEKRAKDNTGIYINIPGKIRVTLKKGTDQVSAYELYAAQFGETGMLNDDLFGRKLYTSVVLNPVTGSLESLKSEQVKK